ncbi:MAG TPA: hypothetical protein VER76_16430, partial [Pyrinomonadaceae bacterium]|nr:hypothetical protein [Pyrinomonadaceae bacterium]
RKASPRGATAGTKSTPEQGTDDATPAAAPTPAPTKTNNREAQTTNAPAAAPAKAETASAKTGADSMAVRYFYEFKQPDFQISRVMIEHDAEGRGQVSFVRKNSEEVFTDPLEIAPAALARIKAAWDALRFLDSDASYQDEKQFPHLGTMTLRMREGTRERTTEFNWTHDEQAAALVKEYRGLGEQQLFVFDVTLARQYQPSDTIKIFKRLESLLDRKELSDNAQLVPLLRDLTTDERIPLMARNHATRLLKKIEKVK